MPNIFSHLNKFSNFKKKRILYDISVNSLKIDANSLRVFGSNDDNYVDPNVYDYVVMAADVGSVQMILKNTYYNYRSSQPILNTLNIAYNNSIGKMKIAPDYKVIRLWFDKQLNASAPDILETPDFTPINLVAQYHLLEAEFASWANKTGGSVIEFQ